MPLELGCLVYQLLVLLHHQQMQIYICVCGLLGLGRSWVYAIYRVGSMTLPCGTPALGRNGYDSVLLIFICHVLSFKYELINLSVLSGTCILL